MTQDELNEHFDDLRDCCLHDPQWLPEDASEVLFAVQDDYEGYDRHIWSAGADGGSEATVIVAARLKDGRYGILVSSEDYTGHGCQCCSYTGTFDTFGLLIRDGLLPEL